MALLCRSLALTGIIVSLCIALPLRAEEAVLPDGKQLSGSLRFTSSGRLGFLSGKRLLTIDDVHQVRFPAVPFVPLRVGFLHRVVLRDGQQLTGELLGLDAESLRLRTAWAARPLTLPRGAIVSLGHLPRQVTYFDEDFEDELKSWKLKGNPVRSDKAHTSGQYSLILTAAGQEAEYGLRVPLGAGNFSINFNDPGPTGAASLLEAEFAGADGTRRLQVTLVGPDNIYRVHPPGGPAVRPKLKRQPGWHRFTCEFAADRLDLLVDDAVLWSSPDRQGPGGPLRAVRLKCVVEKKGSGNAMYFDDFHVARKVADLPRVGAELSRDEVCLLAGDQVFGTVRSANRRAIDLEGRFGQRSFLWSEVRTVSFRRQSGRRAAQRRRIRPHPTSAHRSTGFDQLEGTLRSLDEKSLTLLHAALGELVVDRRYLVELRGLFHGRRLEVDGGVHHLGRRLLPGLPVPKSDGLRLECKFRLESVPNNAVLIVEVSHLKGPKDGRSIARALERGGRRTEVVVNGRTVDYLNRHAEASSSQPRRLRLPLPRGSLRAGENVLELRQTLDRDTGEYEDCVLFGLVIEMPR